MIKKVHKGQHSDTVVLLLTSMIQDQMKERKSLGSDCAVIKDVKDLSSIESSKTHLFATLKLKERKASKCNLLSRLLMFFSISIG